MTDLTLTPLILAHGMPGVYYCGVVDLDYFIPYEYILVAQHIFGLRHPTAKHAREQDVEEHRCVERRERCRKEQHKGRCRGWC